MSRPKRKTVAELEAERDKLNKRIDKARRQAKQAEDADIVKAAEEWAHTIDPEMKRENIAAKLRSNAAYFEKRRAEKQAQQTQRSQWNSGN